MNIDPQYPLGRLPQLPFSERTSQRLYQFAHSLQQAVQEWQDLSVSLQPGDLMRTYRPKSWTIKQLIHHVPEAHMHGLIRLKLGLTTEDYTIQPMEEQALMALPDNELPLSAAVRLLEDLNLQWVSLLTGLPADAFARQIVHPEEGPQDLWQLVAKHDWHLRHHLAQARLALS